MLENLFASLVQPYTPDRQLSASLWKEISDAYGESDRHFHTLTHLEQMTESLLPLKDRCGDWDAVLFAVFYHDYVYDVVRYVTDNDNEDRSAGEAAKALGRIGVPLETIERVRTLILATKDHEASPDEDTNFFVDADLAVLGQPWDVYEAYRKNIRREYGIYPDNIYHAGRTKFLRRMLRSKNVFKTAHFETLYGEAAKENMERELEILSFA